MHKNRVVLKNVNIYQQGLADILIDEGRIIHISKEPGYEVGDAVCHDLKSHLMVPPYVESHIHLDYTYTAFHPSAINRTGTLFEGIARWSEIKKSDDVQTVKERAKRALKHQILSGIQYVRTHVDITDPDLTGLKALLELKE